MRTGAARVGLGVGLLVAACVHAKEPRMVKITGSVTSCEVRDVSKLAGKHNYRAYLAVAVEKSDPATALPASVNFIGAGPYGELKLAAGTRVEISTYVDATRPIDQLKIYELTQL